MVICSENLVNEDQQEFVKILNNRKYFFCPDMENKTMPDEGNTIRAKEKLTKTK